MTEFNLWKFILGCFWVILGMIIITFVDILSSDLTKRVLISILSSLFLIKGIINIVWNGKENSK